MYSDGPPHMAGQKQDDQLEHIYSSYVKIWDVALEDLPEVMKDREKWWERVRDIRACGTMIMMMMKGINFFIPLRY